MHRKRRVSVPLSYLFSFVTKQKQHFPRAKVAATHHTIYSNPRAIRSVKVASQRKLKEEQLDRGFDLHCLMLIKTFLSRQQTYDLFSDVFKSNVSVAYRLIQMIF